MALVFFLLSSDRRRKRKRRETRENAPKTVSSNPIHCRASEKGSEQTSLRSHCILSIAVFLLAATHALKRRRRRRWSYFLVLCVSLSLSHSLRRRIVREEKSRSIKPRQPRPRELIFRGACDHISLAGVISISRWKECILVTVCFLIVVNNEKNQKKTRGEQKKKN